jgi:flagellar biosynthesis protein FliQ
MTPETVVQLIRQALIVAFTLAAPLLAIGFIAGIVTSLVQIATSIQDNAVSSIPRLAAFLVGFLFLLPWLIQKSVGYTTSILGDLSRYAR